MISRGALRPHGLGLLCPYTSPPTPARPLAPAAAPLRWLVRCAAQGPWAGRGGGGATRQGMGIPLPGLAGQLAGGSGARGVAGLSGGGLHFDSHQDLVKALAGLTGDPLEPEGGRMVVFRGNPEAPLMIVGEGPGAEEDRLGKPFVGRSGQLLDKILRAVLLDPERDVYVTNIVKRRPTNNRDPTREEIEYYLPWVEEEIRLVDPKVVILTGRHAMWALLKEKQGITKVRGQWYEAYGRKMMPVFHPSYLLRNPSKEAGSPKALMWEDAKEVRRVLDEICAGGDGGGGS